MALDRPSRRPRRFTRAVALVASTSAARLRVRRFAGQPRRRPGCSRPWPACCRTAAPDRRRTPFATWGDTGDSYFLMPGGGFEAGAPGLDARRRPQGRVGQRDLVRERQATDSHSLAIPTGGAGRVADGLRRDGREHGPLVREELRCRGVGPARAGLRAEPADRARPVDRIRHQGQRRRDGLVAGSPLLIPNLLGGRARNAERHAGVHGERAAGHMEHR